MPGPRGTQFVWSLREASGALGDLGTLLPLMLGAIAVAGLAPMPVLLGFALFYIATALYYRLPLPVQPMKAMAAVLVTGAAASAGADAPAMLAPAMLAAGGAAVGAVLLVLGLTGWIDRLARLVPQSVLAGLQLGLGLALARVALALMATAPALGAITIALLLGLLALRLPAALLALGAAIALGAAFDAPRLAIPAAAGFALPGLPPPDQWDRVLSIYALPQLSLTLTNAVLLTALVARDYFGDAARGVTPARLSITSGLANLALAPLGALPMCHGAAGLAAHHRFGARSGTAPLLLGAALLILALLPQGTGIAALTLVPTAGLGALLLVASGELALTRRLVDSKPSCWPVIAATAAATLWLDPFWGLVAGSVGEVARQAVLRAAAARASGRRH
ncbi:MAG: putative sulfate/molybdate transporter [Rhodospirillales bacterium]|nr:putative sulfate/molybdate transporter [Rhodospirillales bacterium]